MQQFRRDFWMGFEQKKRYSPVTENENIKCICALFVEFFFIEKRIRIEVEIVRFKFYSFARLIN